MRTLQRQCFDKAWIESESRRHRTGNTFFEKCLYAFELLGRLSSVTAHQLHALLCFSANIVLRTTGDALRWKYLDGGKERQGTDT